LFDKNPKSILTNGNASVEQIAEMLMFSNKIVMEIVQRLKSCFNLSDDTNPSWRELFQKGKKIEKKSKTKSKSKNTRIRKKNFVEIEKSKSNNIECDSQTKDDIDNNDLEKNSTEEKQIELVSEKKQKKIKD